MSGNDFIDLESLLLCFASVQQVDRCPLIIDTVPIMQFYSNHCENGHSFQICIYLVFMIGL